MTAYPIRALAAGTCTMVVSAVMCAAGAASTAAAQAPAPQTRTNLTQSMRGEAFANASYTLFAAQAKREGLPSVAALLRNTAGVELNEHFAQEAALSGLVGSSEANLANAIAGESYESTTMYPSFARQARADGDTAAANLFTEIAKDEAVHKAAYQRALTGIRAGKATIPALPPLSPVTVRAGLPKVTSARTKTNLDAAMHGEALAYAKYTLFARHATATGNPALARLFTSAADVELREHFSGEAALAGTVGTTRQNLTKAIAGETYESQTMYPTFARQAKAMGDTAAATLFQHNATDEASHARAFQAARNHLG
jgi:rubrerythrin